MQHNFWRLGWRTLWRDFRAGELRLLIFAVTLAVASLSAVGFFADRLKSGLQRDAKQMLGGDAVLVSDNPAPPQWRDKARQSGLSITLSMTFPTMVRGTDKEGAATKLVGLKVVESGYPLRGSLRIGTPAHPTRDVPKAGEVWADASLLEALDIQVGQTLLLGDSRFKVSDVIVEEPDRGAAFMNFAPRVMINAADLDATHLVQPASRITYRMAVASENPKVVEEFSQWVTDQIKSDNLRGMRVESLQSGRPEMSQTLDRAEKFLNLVALLAALLCAVAVALAARSFAANHLDDCAMLRVLGLSQRAIAASYAFEFILVGLFASASGVVLGYGLHYIFVEMLAGLVQTSLPQSSFWPAALGMGMGLTLLVAFGMPPVLQLAQVPALRVIRRDVGGLRGASAGVLAIGVAGFALLLFAMSRDLKMGLIAVGGFAVAAVVIALFGYMAVKLLRRTVSEETAPTWLVIATRQVSARPAYAVVQISALAVGMLALVLLVLLRTDLVASWRQAVPADAPNRFVINVMPEQADAFKAKLADAGITKFDWYPMFRGRLVAINGKTVSTDDYEDDRAKRLVDREFNLSHSAYRPAHNQIVGGQWVGEEAGAVSMEQGIAETLGLKLGDKLLFDIGGMKVESHITSLRKVDWGSMRANFFAMYPVSKMAGIPITYIAAFKSPELQGFDNALVRTFPNITEVDMTSTVSQIQRVLDQVIQAVEFLFLFTLAAGLVVLFAAISSTREERAQEFAVMRAVGAPNRLLQRVQAAELAGVGGLAGFLASVIAAAVGWALAKYVFSFDWHVPLWLPLAGASAGALLAFAAGWWSLREVLTRPVVQTLRKAAS